MVKKGFFKYIGIIPLFTIISIASFVTFYQFKNNYNNNMLGLRKMTNGLHICFSRVHQTYTASLIKTINSPYLENRFHINTEECFGEVISTLQNEVTASFGHISKKLNKLSKEVHWFHKKIDYQDGKLSKGSGFALDRRFSAIEDEFNSTTERIDRRIKLQEQLAKKSSLVMYISIAFTILFLLLNIYLQYSLNKKKDEIDLIAQEELSKDHISPKKAFFLFRKLSTVLSSERCEKLAEKLNIQTTLKYDNSNEDLSTYKTPSSVSALMPVEPIVFDLDEESTNLSHSSSQDIVAKDQMTILSPLDSREEKLNSVWNKFDNESKVGHETFSQIEDDKEKNINLSVSLAEIIRGFAADFFSLGIEVDFNVDNTHEIIANAEVVFQILHNVLGSAVNLFGDTTRIFIEARSENGREIIEIRDNSKIGFSSDFIQNQDNSAYTHSTQVIGLILSKELAKDIDAKVDFENLFALAGERVGTLRTLSFKAIEKKKRLTFVRKATKSELLKSFDA